MIKEYAWGGIGYGTEAFSEVYPLYAYAGIEAAPHSHNLYMQIVLGMGIGGLICLFLIILFYTQHSFEYIKDPLDNSTRVLSTAAFVSVLSMLIMGMFDYVWYNYRIFFMFWVALAVGVCAIKIGTKELSRKNLVYDSDARSASIDIEF
jgi:O-antigen ligase